MNKILILSVFVLSVIPHAQGAVQKCVALQASENYTSNMGGLVAANCADWGATSSASKITAEGIIGCSKDTFAGTTRDNLSFDVSSTTNNKYCWCKMITPAVSKWVPSDSSQTSEANCLKYCAAACAQKMEYEYYRKLFFQNLKD